jgi:hypothetical protein
MSHISHLILTLSILLTIQGAAQQIPEVQDPVPSEDSQSVVIQPPIPNRQSPRHTERVEFAPEDIVRLQSVEVPPALRKTLDNAEYEGWENGIIHRNIISNEYKVEIQRLQEVRTYYFDQNGEPIPDQ